MIRMISAGDVAGKLGWGAVVQALEDGHRLPKPEISDQFLDNDGRTLLSRAAWIKGLGFGVKSVSVYPENVARGLPSIHGAMLVFDDRDGTLSAVIDSGLITNWKTAADSVLGARLLARPDSRSLLIVGAGSVGESLVHAYREVLPQIDRVTIWNRTHARAVALAAKLAANGHPVTARADLAAACAEADIISAATMSREPVLRGDWTRPGTHVDLIGAFKADMREADDALMQKARLFVDSLDTTLHHIGEFMIPLASGAIRENDVLADLYGLIGGAGGRRGPNDITLFKNGGGAHLDLMTAHCILNCQAGI